MITVGLTPDWIEPTAAEPVGRYTLKSSYAAAVAHAGARPTVLPYTDQPDVLEAHLAQIDALVVTGGAFDVPPELYGEEGHPGLGPQKEGRTRFETAMLGGALERRIPLLGVCGGMQLLNVVRGGTLYQDIQRELPGAMDHEQKHDPSQPLHSLKIVSGSRLAKIFGTTGAIQVNSTHHQSVRDIGDGLVISATSPDGVVEAIEDPDARFVVGVQWHPELLGEYAEQQRLYQALVDAASG